jgi:hypothetical protein
MKYSASILAVCLLVLRSADSFSASHGRRNNIIISTTESCNPTSRKQQHHHSSPLFRERNIPEAGRRKLVASPVRTCSSPTTTALSVATVPVAAITGALTGGLLGGALHAIAGTWFHLVRPFLISWSSGIRSDLHVESDPKNLFSEFSTGFRRQFDITFRRSQPNFFGLVVAISTVLHSSIVASGRP